MTIKLIGVILTSIGLLGIFLISLQHVAAFLSAFIMFVAGGIILLCGWFYKNVKQAENWWDGINER